MKTKRLILALTTWTVVIVMSLHSCQTDSGYDNVIQENNLTEADLFVASEAYKNLEKEIKKNLRRRKNAIDKFSKEEIKRFVNLFFTIIFSVSLISYIFLTVRLFWLFLISSPVPPH